MVRCLGFNRMRVDRLHGPHGADQRHAQEAQQPCDSARSRIPRTMLSNRV
jgi:hypothetical protein